MAQPLGRLLPPPVVERLGRDVYDPTLVVPLLTMDSGGYPHVALLSTSEIVVTGDAALRLAVAAASGSAGNLRRTGRATLLIADSTGAFYVKARVTEREAGLSSTPWNAVFDARVEEILADAADPQREGASHLTSGLRYDPDPAFDAARAAVHDELAHLD